MYLKTNNLIGFRRIYEIVFIESNKNHNYSNLNRILMCVNVIRCDKNKAIDGTRSVTDYVLSRISVLTRIST